MKPTSLRIVPPAPLRPQLGDMLQRLALISPHDLYLVTQFVRFVLQQAEREHAARFPRFHTQEDVS